MTQTLVHLVHLVRTCSGSFCEQKHIQAAETDAWYIHVLHPNLTLVHLKLNLVQFKGHSGDERRSTKNAKASIGAIESMIDPRSSNDTSGAVKSCTVDVFLVHARL